MTPEQLEEQVSHMIRFFNLKAGTSYKVQNADNRKIVQEAIEKAVDITALKRYIMSNASAYSKNMRALFEAFIDEKNSKEIKTTNTQETSDAIKVLGKAVAQIVSEQKSDEIADKIMESVEGRVQAFIEKEYGAITRKVNTIVNGQPTKVDGVTHEKFEEVLKFVANKEPVFLTGGAGTGKNVLCKQVADALGLEFYFTNAVTQEYKLTGFTDAVGVYHETQFYKAFSKGGLFMLDEMDASIPEVLIILNSAIANGYFDFPAPVGKVYAHENFRVISAGNTFGLGADYEYVGRNQLDMASLDRFALVKIDYSPAIEMAVSNNNKELCDFARAFRESAKKSGVRAICSYRAIGRIAKLEELLGIEETLKTCLIKNLGNDELRNIKSNMAIKGNRYYDAFCRCIGD